MSDLGKLGGKAKVSYNDPTEGIVTTVEDARNDTIVDTLDKILIELKLTNELLKGILQ